MYNIKAPCSYFSLFDEDVPVSMQTQFESYRYISDLYYYLFIYVLIYLSYLIRIYFIRF